METIINNKEKEIVIFTNEYYKLDKKDKKKALQALLKVIGEEIEKL